MKVFSRLNTRAMRTPMGFVTASMSTRKTSICNHPLTVMSELLRTQQCVDQVHHGESTHCEHDHRFHTHIVLLTSRAHKNARKRSIRQRTRSSRPRKSDPA